MPWLTPALPAFSPATHPYLTIRPLAPLEAGPLQAVFQGLSAKSRQLRYHTPVSVLRPAMLRHLTDVDPGRHVAVVATFGGRPVGIGRWLRDPLRLLLLGWCEMETFRGCHDRSLVLPPFDHCGQYPVYTYGHDPGPCMERKCNGVLRRRLGRTSQCGHRIG